MKKIFGLFVISLCFGCSLSPKIQVPDSSFAVENLTDALSLKRIALTGSYRRPGVKSCHIVAEQNKIQAAIDGLGGTLIAYKDMRLGDIHINYAWDCLAYTKLGSGSSGSQIGELFSIWTLGLLPSVSRKGELTFDVEITTYSGRQIYEGHYSEESRTLGNLYTDHTEILAKNFGEKAEVVIGKFINDIDREGVFE